MMAPTLVAHHRGDRRIRGAADRCAALRKRSVTRSRYGSVRGAENAAMAGTRFTFCNRRANAGYLRHMVCEPGATLVAQAPQRAASPGKGKRTALTRGCIPPWSNGVRKSCVSSGFSRFGTCCANPQAASSPYCMRARRSLRRRRTCSITPFFTTTTTSQATAREIIKTSNNGISSPEEVISPSVRQSLRSRARAVCAEPV